MRYTAALGHLQIETTSHNKSGSITDTIVEGLNTDFWANTSNKDTSKALHYMYAEATPFDQAIQIINKHSRFRP